MVGQVRRAHGLRGDVIVESITNDPAAVFREGRQLFGGTPSGTIDMTAPPLTIRRASPFQKRGWLLQLDELADRTAAEAWRGRLLLAPLDAVARCGPDEVFYHDLVGLTVERTDGTVVGAVDGWFELPNALLLSLATATGEKLLPYLPTVIQRVDLARRVIVVDPPIGLFD